MQEGFTLLQQLAPFPRDYLLPSPATNLSGAITKEMRYETGYGLQNRVLLYLKVGEESLHILGTTQFWTPHSGRAFLPSATTLLGFDKTDRELPGWLDGPGKRQVRTCITDEDPEHAKGSDSSATGASRPLGEAETTAQLETYLSGRSVPDEARRKYLETLTSKRSTEVLIN